jgi:hypothetical protein
MRRGGRVVGGGGGRGWGRAWEGELGRGGRGTAGGEVEEGRWGSGTPDLLS